MGGDASLDESNLIAPAQNPMGDSYKSPSQSWPRAGILAAIRTIIEDLAKTTAIEINLNIATVVLSDLQVLR